MDTQLKNTRPGTLVRKQDLLERIVSYIDANLGDKVTLQTVAAHCGVSVSTVTQLFQRVENTTFHTYLTRRRMAAAEVLIREGLPLEEVGKQVGFQDHSSFYRAFRQTFGMSPREFRREAGK